MAQQTINIGASPNDGTGTPLRTAFQYTNSNFSELYTAVGPSGNNIVVPGNATITGDLTVDTSTLKVNSSANQVGVGITTFTGAQSLQVLTGLRVSNANPETVNCLNLAVTSTTSTIETRYETPLILGTSAVERYRISDTGIVTWSNVNNVAGTAMTLNATGLGVGTSPTGYGILALKKDNTSAPPYIVLDNRGTGGTDTNTYTQGGILFGAFRDVSNPAYIASITVERKSAAGGASSTGDLIFGTASTPTNGVATERLRIDASGNCGIGVTPSAWAAAFKPVQIGSGTVSSAFIGQTNSPVARIMTNSYFDGTNFVKVQNNTAGMYVLSNNQHEWHNAATGTGTFSFVQAMTLDASGNLLVGKTASSSTVVGAELRPSGAIISTLAASTNADFALYTYSTGAGAARFYVGMSGTVFATNTTISAISDQRLKENVQDIDVGLGAILALKPRKFDWKEGKGKDIKGDRGFIAQEFEQVFPQLVDEWADPAPEGEAPYKSVRQDLIPVLVKAIQELAAEVNALKNA